MKLFISSDMEGTAGICAWPETDIGGFDYAHYAKQMTKEVAAACQGALDGGATEIVVKDAHDSARNINPEALPKGVSIHRGWAKTPECMMAGIEKGCHAAAMTGYHNAAHGDGNPLAHTMNGKIQYLKMNGTYCSEFQINAYTAAYYKVPVIFLSGDLALCESAKMLIPEITTVAVSEGFGEGSLSMHPLTAIEQIREGMKQAVLKDTNRCQLSLPSQFDIEVEYKEPGKAVYASFYPGAKVAGERGIEFHTTDYYEALRFFLFVL